MLLEIRGHHLPGRDWHLEDGPCHNVHVGVQLGRVPAELVAGDASSATWTAEVSVIQRDGGEVDRVVVSVHLTDHRGGPRCARLRPPAIEFHTG